MSYYSPNLRCQVTPVMENFKQDLMGTWRNPLVISLTFNSLATLGNKRDNCLLNKKPSTSGKGAERILGVNLEVLLLRSSHPFEST